MKKNTLGPLITFAFLGFQLSPTWDLKLATVSSSATKGTLINVTGYAATRASWDAHHVADARPNIVPGITYNLFHDPNRDRMIDKCSTV